LAFSMAPYQHVHLGMSHEEAADEHHHDDHGDEAPVVHIHFYAESVPENQTGQPSFDHPDKDHVSRPLDTFGTMPPMHVPVLAHPESRVLIFPPMKWVVAIIEGIEPCGHDPPFLAFSSPR